MATQQLSTPRFDFIRFHLCKYMKDINIFSENILLVFLLEFYMDFEPYEKDLNEKTLLFFDSEYKNIFESKAIYENTYYKIQHIKYNYFIIYDEFKIMLFEKRISETIFPSLVKDFRFILL